MINYSDRALRARIVFSGMLLPVIVICPMIIAFYFYGRNTAIQSHLDKAKAVCLTAKSISSEQGCEFKPVRSNNKDFELSFAERRLFDPKYLASDETKDFYVLDDTKGLLCYTAFIRARRSCLSCHGDPRKSKKLWVEMGETKTVPVGLTGFEEGDIFGAYEVIAQLSRAEKQSAGATFIAGIMLLAGISIYSISFFAIVSYVLNQHRGQQKEQNLYDWQIYDLGDAIDNRQKEGSHEPSISD